ncbi:MAG: ComEC/Rec2 family competence protein [Candidatus Sungiibacteriota bacterium]
MANLAKSQVFFWILASFIGGVLLRSFLQVPMYAIWALFIFGITCLLAGLVKFNERKDVVWLSLFILALAFGMLRHFQKTEIITRSLDPFLGQSLTLKGVIDDEPVRAAKSQRIIIRVPESGNQKVLVFMRPYPEFSYGEEVKVFGTIEEPENFAEDFDYRSYLAKDGIFYVMSFPEIERIGAEKGSPLYQNLFKLKHAFSGKVQSILPEPESAFIGGLILGERTAIPEEITEAFRRTGTSHVVALSGYNITIVASSLMRFLGIFYLPLSVTFWLSGAGIVMFTMLTGAAASVVRASVMGLLVLIAQKSGRIYHMRNALAFAGAMMIFHNPAILRFDASFQLSFLATLGLLYGAPIIDGWFEKVKNRARILLRASLGTAEIRAPLREPPKSFLREIFVSTLAAQIFVLPLLIYNFGQVSLLSPLVNLLILPLIPFTMFSGFIAGASGLVFLPLAKVMGWVAWLAAHYELSTISFFSNFAGASVEVGKLALVPLAALYGWTFWKIYRRT